MVKLSSLDKQLIHRKIFASILTQGDWNIRNMNDYFSNPSFFSSMHYDTNGIFVSIGLSLSLLFILDLYLLQIILR